MQLAPLAAALKFINDVTLAENWDWDDDRSGEPVCFEVVEVVRDGIAEWISDYEEAKKMEDDERKKDQREKAKKDAEEQRLTKKTITEPERRQYAKQQLGSFASAPPLPKTQKPPPSRSDTGVREVDLVKDLFG